MARSKYRPGMYVRRRGGGRGAADSSGGTVACLAAEMRILSMAGGRRASSQKYPSVVGARAHNVSQQK